MKRRSKGDGSVFYWEERGEWVARLTLPNGKKKVKYGKTQKEVRDWLTDQRKALKDGVITSDDRATVEEFLRRWFDDVVVHFLRPATLITEESIMRRHIYPTIGSIRLSQLTPALLQALYSEKLKEGLSKRTVKYIHTIMHRSLDHAVKWGLVARNVAKAVESPSPDKTPVKPLTGTQVKCLLEALKGDRLYAFYVLLLSTGLRRGEALALTTESLDLENRVIRVTGTLSALKGRGLVVGEPKSLRSRRAVAIPDFTRDVLKKHLEERGVESCYVFCTSRGTPFTPRNVVRHFKKTLKRAGLPPTIRVHDLRHTFVSYLLSKNVPPTDVQKIAGHASFSTTADIYGHLMDQAERDAADKVAGMFG